MAEVLSRGGTIITLKKLLHQRPFLLIGRARLIHNIYIYMNVIHIYDTKLRSDPFADHRAHYYTVDFGFRTYNT